MSKQFFRLLFGTMLFVAAAAFTACTDDDKTEAPELTANPTVLNFTTETALTQTVAITANCEWKVTTSGLEWATVTPAAGKGNATLSVTVGELPADVKARTGKISFTMIHPEFGPWGTAESTVTVNQAGEGGIVPPPTPIRSISITSTRPSPRRLTAAARRILIWISSTAGRTRRVPVRPMWRMNIPV